MKLVPFFLFLLWVAALALSSFPDYQGTDLYPLLHCSRALVAGRSPYNPEVAKELAARWEVAQQGVEVAALCAYPLPFYALLTPLLVVPEPLQVKLWWGLLLLIAPVAWKIREETNGRGWEGLLIAVTYYPLFHGITLKTSTVLISIFLGGMVLWERKELKTPWWAAIPLLLKPQVALLPVLLGMRRGLEKLTLVASLVLLIPITICYPTWMSDWVSVTVTYTGNAAIHRPFSSATLVVVLPLVTILTWHLGLMAVAIVLQILLWPMNDLYCVIPFLYPILRMPFAVAIMVSSVSWISPLVFRYPNSIEGALLTTIMPFMIGCYLSRRRWKGV